MTTAQSPHPGGTAQRACGTRAEWCTRRRVGRHSTPDSRWAGDSLLAATRFRTGSLREVLTTKLFSKLSPRGREPVRESESSKPRPISASTGQYTKSSACISNGQFEKFVAFHNHDVSKWRSRARLCKRTDHIESLVSRVRLVEFG